MTYIGRRVTQIIDWDVTGIEGINDKWEIEQSQNIDDALKSYIEEANEHEDQELSDLEVKRLQDFVLYLKVR